jgi:putative DNA primase/helicase
MTTRNGADWSSFCAQVNAAALARYPELLYQWFPPGRVVGREFACCNLNGDSGKSFKVNLDSGRWSDFATEAPGGDPISLYARLHQLTQGKAAQALARELGITPPQVTKEAPDSASGANRGSKSKHADCVPIAPVPPAALEAIVAGGKNLRNGTRIGESPPVTRGYTSSRTAV